MIYFKIQFEMKYYQNAQKRNLNLNVGNKCNVSGGWKIKKQSGELFLIVVCVKEIHSVTLQSNTTMIVKNRHKTLQE